MIELVWLKSDKPDNEKKKNLALYISLMISQIANQSIELIPLIPGLTSLATEPEAVDFSSSERSLQKNLD